MWWLTGQIASAISDTGGVVDDADITRLFRAARKLGGDYFVAGGTTNALTINPTRAFASLGDLLGVPLRILIGSSNTGAATLNVSGLGNVPIVTRGNVAVAADDLQGGAIQMVFYNGTSFMLAGLARSEVVTATSLTYNVAPTGADSNPGTVGSPFLTLQRAIEVGSRVRTINGSVININVANGTYAPFVANVRDTTFNIIGNTAAPANCVIANAVAGSPCASFLGSRATLRGFKLTGIGPGVSAAEQANIKVGNLELGIDGSQSTQGYSISASGASLVRLIGPVRQLAQNLGAVFVSGAGSTVDLGGQAITMDAFNAILSGGVPGITAWANGGFISAASVSFLGVGPNYGKRYQSDSGSGSIWTGGAGVNFIPGTVAGTGTYA